MGVLHHMQGVEVFKHPAAQGQKRIGKGIAVRYDIMQDLVLR